MFSTTTIPAIETVQKAKSTVLTTMIPDAKFRQPFEAMIEAETQFAKAMVRATEHLYTQISDYKFAK